MFAAMREKASRAASAAASATRNASSRVMASSRSASASMGDSSKAEIASNTRICMERAAVICSEGRVPIEGELMYKDETDTVYGSEITLRKATDAGKAYIQTFDQQNYQTIRRALPSKGVKPGVGEPKKMEQYAADMKTMSDMLSKHGIKDPASKPVVAAPANVAGGRRTRRRRKSAKRAPRGRKSTKRASRGRGSVKRSRSHRKRR